MFVLKVMLLWELHPDFAKPEMLDTL